MKLYTVPFCAGYVELSCLRSLSGHELEWEWSSRLAPLEPIQMGSIGYPAVMACRRSAHSVAFLVCIACNSEVTAQPTDSDVVRALNQVRSQHRVPALGAAVVTSQGLILNPAVG